MDTKTTAPATAGVTSPAAITAPPATASSAGAAQIAKLSTYEDCIKVISDARNSTTASDKDNALVRLETFFKDRIGRKAANEERDGMTAVKRALGTNRFSRPSASTGGISSELKPGS